MAIHLAVYHSQAGEEVRLAVVAVDHLVTGFVCRKVLVADVQVGVAWGQVCCRSDAHLPVVTVIVRCEKLECQVDIPDSEADSLDMGLAVVVVVVVAAVVVVVDRTSVIVCCLVSWQV